MPPVEVKLLGPLEVVVDGRPVELRRKKQRALLALLALRAGEVVSTDRLVDDLWGETPPKAAVGSLQNLISELRKVLGADLVVTRPPGYVLELDRDSIDAHRFERQVRDGHAIREAVALWRGPALADLAFEPFAQAEIARLEELRAVAQEELFDAELELGNDAQLVPEIEAFIAAHPLRERPRGQLMLALYRSGRQADALDAYRKAREALVDELGIEPSAELQRLEQAILRHDPAVDLQRREKTGPKPDRRQTVTVLFADVVASTELGAQLDPEVVRSVMTSYFDAVRTIVERHGGLVEKFIGDAAMAVFGVPRLHEDDAVRAVRAATELRDAMTALNAEVVEEHGIPLQVRIGLSSGEVLISDSGSGDSFATGKPVNLAMRLEERALPGEILIGESTYRLARHSVEAEPVEPLALGPLGRVDAFRVMELGDATRPLGRAALIGRDQELARLRAAVAGVRAERRSSVVTVFGEAGVGKSRLASELLAGLGADTRALVGRCVSYGEGATFLPLEEIVRQAVPNRPRHEVVSLLGDDEHAHLIAERVTQLTGSADGIASTGEVFWAVRRFFEALALRQPLVVVLEDLHWAEPTLLDLVEYLDAWTANAPLLVLCLARPDLFEQRPGWGSSATTFTLEPLADDEAQLLVADLAGDALTEKAATRIVDAAEGNPLFLEQLLAYADEAGAEVLAEVPPSVEALLGARIDRLEPEERALLERAAVAGRDFERSAMVHLSPPDELPAIDRRLRTLVRRGLVETERGDTFRFHHALIRDCTYAGITKAARAELHERFGTWLEQREEGAEEIVGYHLEQAHRYRSELRPRDPALPPLAKRAGDRLADAGMRAFKHADTSATVNLLGRSVLLLPTDSSERIDALCELGIAQQVTGDVAAAASTLTEAVEQAHGARDERRELFARIELLYLRLFTDEEADPNELLDLSRQARETFERVGDDRALGRAWRHVGAVRGSAQGMCAEWVVAAEAALSHYRKAGWSAAGCFAELTAALFHGPTRVPDAIDRCEQLLGEATDRLGTASVLTHLGGLHALSTRSEDAFGLLLDADQIYRDLGELYTRANVVGRVLGRAHVLAGDVEAAEHVFRECCGIFEHAQNRADFSTIASELGQTLYSQGRYDEASEWARSAEAHAQRFDISAQFAWRALQGKVLAQRGQFADGEALLHEAVELVVRTDLLTHRGEILLDLAHVLSLAERDREAATTIEEALALFELKGNLASARYAQSRLAELALI